MASTPAAPDSLFFEFQQALAGRYSIDRELGRGGMGIVYLAREVHLDRMVAIKLLPPEKASANASLRERFLYEARLAAKLSHPNIIPIHSVDEVDGFVFYVMSYVDGETLTHRVRTRGPLSVSESARMLREVAWALGHAHSQGLVHCDVKPDNILLESGSGRVLVTDFGIAAAAGAASESGVAGTPEFMSPEQALGQPMDARSDLYALGATAFYTLSGRLPFEGGSSTQLLARQVTEPAPPVASLGLTVPRKLAALIDRCLSKAPEHRPVSAEALAEQLGVALEQRKELPAALRAFVKRTGRVDGAGALLWWFGIASVSVWTAATSGGVAGIITFAQGMTLHPFLYLVYAARRLSLLGFGYTDLAPAFSAEMEQSREEFAVEGGGTPSRLERFVGSAARVMLSVYGLATAGFASSQALRISLVPSWPGYWGLLGLLTLTTSIGWLALTQKRRDLELELWKKLWTGRIGRAAFAIARKLLGRRVIGSAVTHRATELSLSMAAEKLFESLPKETRRSLGDLPALVNRLRDDAKLLRARYEALKDALSEETGDALGDARLRAPRDEVHTKLGEAVGALETIRLNLLRLHAGSGSVSNLTTHIGLAVEMSADIERLLAGREEMERGLAFPRERIPTPA